MRRTISSVNRLAAGIGLAFALLIGALALHADLTGEGLRGTQKYLMLGEAIYPIFYGSIAYLVYWPARWLVRSKDYISADALFIKVGGKEFPIDGLQVEIRRNFLGLRELVFIPNGRRPFGVKSYFLSRPLAEVIAALNSVLKPNESEAFAD